MTRQKYAKRIFSLTSLFVRQELIDKHGADILGLFWLILQPLAYIVVYTLVFSNIMSAKLGGFAGVYSYSIYLVSGLLMWQLVFGIINSVSGVYISKASLIRKTPVPLFFVPLYLPIVETIYFFISLTIFLLFLLFVDKLPSKELFLFIPLIIFPQLFIAYSISLFLSVFSVFISDTQKIIALFMQLLFWATPIVYPATILPPYLLSIIELNPFFWGVSAMHDIFLFSRQPPLMPILYITIISSLIYLLAYLFFKKRERELRDLL